MTLGGRAAEEIVFDEVTTGAANDLEKVTDTAKQMVMRYGMSEKLGPRVLGRDRGQPFLGREFATSPTTPTRSPARSTTRSAASSRTPTRRAEGAAHRAQRDDLHRISQILIERETIDKDQFMALLAGKPEDEVFAETRSPRSQPSRRPPPSGPSARAPGRCRGRGRGTPAATQAEPFSEVDGGGQRDPGLVFRWGALPGPEAAIGHGRDWSPRARRSSMWAGNRPGPGRRRER